MKITRAVVPSLFTVLNMFSGFMSIVHASKGELLPASWFIILAAGFDALDGVMARITKSSSQFGVEIDSLSDVVSFGVAPAFLVYKFSLYQLGGVGIFVSSLLMIFAGLRLARFNVQLVGFDKDHFVGLPAPASAIAMAAFVLNALRDATSLENAAAPYVPWLAVTLSLLMVSKVRYDTLPRISRKSVRKDPWKFIFLGLAVVVVFVTGGSAIFPLFALFISIGIVRYLADLVRRIGRTSGRLEEETMEETRAEP